MFKLNLIQVYSKLFNKKNLFISTYILYINKIQYSLNMKKYLKFVTEDLEETKERIADRMQSETTSDDDNEKMELDEKPNEQITQDIEKTIENFEQQKVIINKKIETFNDEIAISEDPDIVKDLEEKVKQLEEELEKFDNLLNDATNQKTTLEDTQNQE